MRHKAKFTKKIIYKLIEISYKKDTNISDENIKYSSVVVIISFLPPTSILPREKYIGTIKIFKTKAKMVAIIRIMLLIRYFCKYCYH